MPGKFKPSRTEPPTEQEICDIISDLRGSEYLREAKKHLMILALRELLDRRANE